MQRTGAKSYLPFVHVELTKLARLGLEQFLVDQCKITIARGPSEGPEVLRFLIPAIQKIVLRKRIELLPFVRRSRDNGGSRDPRR